jgi:uncharacterized protein (TIGR03067 family)
MPRTAAALLLFFAPGLSAGPPAQDPSAKADAPAKLTKDGLDKMLEKLGYETKALDKVFTQVTVERPGWVSRLRVSLSNDATRVWLDAWFVTVTRPGDVPAATWRRLAAGNEDVSPAAFSFNPVNKRVYLSHSLPNENVTPITLRKEIEFLDGWVEKTYDLWKLSNFVPEMTTEGEKELATLAGRWRVAEFSDQGKPLAADEAAKFSLVVEKNLFQLQKDGKTFRSGQLVAGAGGKGHLDRYETSGSVRGLYRLDGDTLTWAYAPGDRPATFAGDAKTLTTLLVLRREK